MDDPGVDRDSDIKDFSITQASLPQAFRLAMEHQKAGRLESAERVYRAILGKRPKHADALHLLGMTRFQQGEAKEAAGLIRQAIKQRDDAAAFHANLGVVLDALGQREASLAAIGRARELEPDSPVPWRRLGDLHMRRDEIESALAAYREAALRAPRDATIQFGLGYAFARARRPDEAEAHYRQAVEFDPSSVPARSNLAGLTLARGDAEGAVLLLRQVTEIAPQDPQGFYNLARALEAADKPELALRCYDRAVALVPGHAAALNNAGALLQRLGRLAEAEARFEAALGAQPDHANAHLNRALLWLLQGRYDVGWAEYEWRLRHRELSGLVGSRPFAQPAWNGEALDGRTILLWGEQGVGDEILFASLIPDLAAAGARCLVEADPRLVPLFARSFPGIEVVARSDPPAPATAGSGIACQSALGSLARHLRPGLDAFPDRGGHLAADPARAEALRARYRARAPGTMTVGMSWRDRGRAKSNRSVPLELWDPLLTLPGLSFVNLQYGDSAEEVAAAAARTGTDIYADPEIDPMADLDGLAAQMAALDIVVTVANTTAHLAGGLGVPLWVLVPRVPNWPWRLEGATTPWYPAARLFRQPEDGGWPAVMGDIVHAFMAL